MGFRGSRPTSCCRDPKGEFSTGPRGRGRGWGQGQGWTVERILSLLNEPLTAPSNRHGEVGGDLQRERHRVTSTRCCPHTQPHRQIVLGHGHDSCGARGPPQAAWKGCHFHISQGLELAFLKHVPSERFCMEGTQGVLGDSVSHSQNVTGQGTFLRGWLPQITPCAQSFTCCA